MRLFNKRNMNKKLHRVNESNRTMYHFIPRNEREN